MSRVSIELQPCVNPECAEEFVVTRSGETLCPLCRAKVEAIWRITAQTAAGESVHARLDRIGVNVRRHGHLTLDELGPAAEVCAEFAEAIIAADRWDAVRGLYLDGPTGTGKSQHAVSLVRALWERGYTGSIVYDRSRALATTIQDRYGSGTVDDVIAARRKAGVWILEDAGTEKNTPDAFRIFEDIIDAREGHPTVITSNLRPPELASFWAEKDAVGRLRSRLGPENYREVRLDGRDRRFPG